MRNVTLVLLAVCCLAIPPFARASTGYDLLELGSLGGRESWALGINNNGAVVGCAVDGNGRQRAFLWTPEGGMTDLGTLGGANAAALGINDFGEIVGWSETADGARHAFLRTTELEMVDLGVLPGDASSESSAVADIVVGTSTSSSGAMHAFYWSVDTNQVALATLVPGGAAQAFDVNRAGYIVGSSNDAASVPRAVLWHLDGTVQELGTLGGATNCAYGINEAGLVVGESADASGRLRAFCWLQGIGIHALPEPRGATAARASCVNNSYQAAGFAVSAASRAVLWNLTRDFAKGIRARVIVLPVPRETVESVATAINDGGLVAGYYTAADGRRQAVVWRPSAAKRAVVSMALTGGLFVPVSAATRKEFTNTWLRVALQPFQRERSTVPHFTAESAAFRLDGPTSVRLYDITFGLEKGLAAGPVAQSYVALRGGPCYGKLDRQAAGRHETKWGLNLNAAYGIIFLRSLYAEVRYDYFSRFAGIDFSGLSLSAGVRLFDLPR